MRKNNKTYRIVILAILTAIIMVQAMVPFLGFIPLGPVSLTIIHVTVIVAAIILGPVDGMIVGLAWGICTIIRAFAAPTTPLDTLIFTNPIVSVVPRVLVGLVAGGIFRMIYRFTKKTTPAAIVAAALGSLTNTILVLFFMGILYTGPVATAYGVDASKLFVTLGALVISNGIPEIITACVITPLLVKALFTATHLEPQLKS